MDLLVTWCSGGDVVVLDPWRTHQRQVLVGLRGEATQEDVARAAGLRYWRYVNLETGKVEMATREVPPLARAYGISAEELAARLGVTVDQGADALETLRDRLEGAGVPDDEVREVTSEMCRLGPDAHLEGAAVAEIVEEHHEVTHPKRREATS